MAVRTTEKGLEWLCDWCFQPIVGASFKATWKKMYHDPACWEASAPLPEGAPRTCLAVAWRSGSVCGAPAVNGDLCERHWFDGGGDD